MYTHFFLQRVGIYVFHCSVLMWANSPKCPCRFMDVCSCVSGHSSAVYVGMVVVLVLLVIHLDFIALTICFVVQCFANGCCDCHWTHGSLLNYSLTFGMVTVTPQQLRSPAYCTNGGQSSEMSHEPNDSLTTILQNALSIP